MDLMQIKIAKDEQIVSYIKLIREYDKSMSMSHKTENRVERFCSNI